METMNNTKTYSVDKTHSNIGFNVKHMMFSKVKGNFENYEASVDFDGENFENAKLAFKAEAASINTNNEDRDNHLRSADFFNAEQNSTIEFESTSVKSKGGNDYTIEGNLTMNGVTRPVVLDAEFSGIMVDPWGNDRIALALGGKVNRFDWDMKWSQALETGGLLVSKEVVFDIETQFV